MPRVVVAMIVAVLGLGTAAACGSESPPPNSPSGSASVDATATGVALGGAGCDLLTLEAVSAFMGQTAHIDNGSATECVWLTQTDGVYQLHLQIYSERTYYAPEQWGTPEPILALGQEAFLVREGVVGTVAGYWDGEHAVFLNYAKLVGPGEPSDKADALVLLLRAVSERL